MLLLSNGSLKGMPQDMFPNVACVCSSNIFRLILDPALRSACFELFQIFRILFTILAGFSGMFLDLILAISPHPPNPEVARTGKERGSGISLAHQLLFSMAPLLPMGGECIS